jgi:hypothetical protein
MRNQRFENKKSQKSSFQDSEENLGKRHKSFDHKENKNWKNRLIQNDEDENDEDFFHFDEDEE